MSLSRKWEEFVANNSLLAEVEDSFKLKAAEKIEVCKSKIARRRFLTNIFVFRVLRRKLQKLRQEA